MTYKSKLKSIDEIVKLFKKNDSLAIPLATGQPYGLLAALSEKQDWENLDLFAGLFGFPFPLLMNPAVKLTSGYYGPIERYLNKEGAPVEYLPSNFRGFEYYAMRKPKRVIAATVSPPDKEGFVTFGTHGAAAYNPFVKQLKAKDRLAIAEINPNMPVVYGDPALGDNKIHINEIEFIFESNQTAPELPDIKPTTTEEKIAEHVTSLIEDSDTLQFGIGAVPDLIAEKLSHGKAGNFGIHSELISDGFLKLHESGKLTNQNKGCYKGQTVFTFAFGTKALYDFLDERNGQNNRQAICLPVTTVNDPAVIRQNKNFVSINSGLMIDFAGQVCSEAIGSRQYSGVGGQLSFVQGACEAENGKSILCIKSTANVNGKTISNITPQLPLGSLISTPRHFVQFIVTEFGVADLRYLSDEKRGPELIKVAHPDFRDELTEAWTKIEKEYFKPKG